MNNIKNSNFIKSIFQLAAGSIIAQIVTIACSPIVTRLFSVEDMGLYALILTISSIFGSVINGKYDYAIVSADDERDIYPLIGLSMIVTLVLSLIIGVGFTFYLFFNPFIWEKLGIWVYLSIILLITNGVANVLVSYNNRMKEYKIISQVYVQRTFIQNALLVLSGFFSFGAIGMLMSQLIGSLFGLKTQSKSLVLDPRADFKTIFNLKEIKYSMKKYIDFPLYSLPANLVNNMSYSLLNFFISGLFGLKVLGFYSMTYRILGLPLSLISVNVSKVFFREAAEEIKETGGFSNSLKKSVLLLLPMAIPMFLILYFGGPILFSIFFGAEWYVAGEYAKILAFLFSVRLIVGAHTPAFIVRGKQRLELIFQILFLISSILCYFLTKILDLDMLVFLNIYAIINTIIYLSLFLLIIKLSRGEKND